MGLRCLQRILDALKASQRPGNPLDFIAVKLYGVGLNDKIMDFMECALLARCPVLIYIACSAPDAASCKAGFAHWVSPA